MHVLTRPLKRNVAQKLANRQSILTAGMLTFKDKGYSNTSVEDVLIRADVSRATFYKHFSSKFSLAEALVDEMAARQDRAYDKLALIESPSQTDIVAWLDSVAEIFVENKLLLMVLFELLGAEPRLREASRTANIKRIGKLARSISSFRHASANDADASARRDRALLLMTEIDVILFRVTIEEWNIDRDVAIHFLVAQIQHFVDSNSAGTPVIAPALH